LIEGGELIMKDETVRIEKVKNGWIVQHNWEEGEGANESFESEEYVFSTREEAFEKMRELLVNLEPAADTVAEKTSESA